MLTGLNNHSWMELGGRCGGWGESRFLGETPEAKLSSQDFSIIITMTLAQKCKGPA